MIELFEQAGGNGKPRYGGITMCWAETDEQGRKTALEVWPNAALGGDLGYELPLPRHYEEATESVTEEDIGDAIPCGPDVDRYVESFREYEQAGYTHVYVHQVGRDQEGFFRFFEEELKPKL